MEEKSSKGKPKRKVASKKGAKIVSAKTMPGGADIKSAIEDILGRTPKEITVEFEKLKKMGPGGVRAADGDWSGNIYKYRY